MNRIIITFLLIFSVHSVKPQFAENNAIYATVELNIGNYVGGDLNLNWVYKEKYSLKLGYTGNTRKPRSQPEDYSSGVVGIMLFGLGGPNDQLETFQISAGRIYKLNKTGTIRANLSAGIGYTTIGEPVNWQRSNNGFLGENYSWEYRKYSTVSLIINPKIEFPLSRFYGLTLSPMVQINKNRTYFGIGLGSMIGLLRKRDNLTSDRNLENSSD